jgi:hypothetical protein
MTAAAVLVAVAAADSVAAVSEATAAIVVPAGTPVPVIERPTSSLRNVPAGPVTAVEADVLVRAGIVLGSVLRPVTT